MNELTPTEKWSRETARTLVTCYLADAPDLNLEDLVGDLLNGSTNEQMGELLYTLVSAVGEAFEGIDDFSQKVLNALGEESE